MSKDTTKTTKTKPAKASKSAQMKADNRLREKLGIPTASEQKLQNKTNNTQVPPQNSDSIRRAKYFEEYGRKQAAQEKQNAITKRARHNRAALWNIKKASMIPNPYLEEATKAPLKEDSVRQAKAREQYIKKAFKPVKKK